MNGIEEEIQVLSDGRLTLMSTAKKCNLTSDTELLSECPQDQDLLQACRSGSVSAFEQLYLTHGPRMKSVACNLLGNISDAEDAIQESFLKIYNRLGEFRGRSAFSTWVFRLLVNTCYDLARKRKRYPPSIGWQDETQRNLLSHGTDHPLRLTLERSLQRLDMRSRSVFLLFEVEGFSHREIAEILQIREGTSKSLLFDAKRKLQSWIGGGISRP